MQLLATDKYYFVKEIRTILKVCRKTSQLSVTHHSELASLEDIQICSDSIHCFIGKIRIQGVDYLLFVIESTEVAVLTHPQSTVRRIDKVCALPVLDDGFAHSQIFERSSDGPSKSLAKLRNHKRKLVKFVSDKVNNSIIIDLVNFINESGTFYFSFGMDLTLSTQRHNQDHSASDPRFFWNKEMLRDLLDDDDQPSTIFETWVVPIIHGYVAQKSICFETNVQANFTLISRRSARRAGVRYLRRGIDEDGECANFVETEEIISAFGHCLSYLQIRGSVPVFWSQKESLPAFEKHFKQMIEEYGSPIVIVNLVEQTGRELCLGESYLQHVLELNSPEIAFYSFDFHHNCRALRFDKVGNLVEALKDDFNAIGFCWLDKDGLMVAKQKGVIRTNCVDCLDRTNVVQSSISQAVTLLQARKLGLIEYITETPDVATDSLIRLLQGMWADHGDCISKQYAGTNALKGDVTRGGQRKFMGLVKDGYNSASRYYLSQVHDARRQRIIDTFLQGSDARVNNDENRNGWSAAETQEDELDDEQETDVEVEGENDSAEQVAPDSVRFNTTVSEIVMSEWALDAALKRKIAESMVNLFQGKTALVVITGASRGIVALAEVRDEILKSHPNISIELIVADLSQHYSGSIDERIAMLEEKIKFNIRLIIHNAGTVGDLGKRSSELTDDLQWISYLQTNFISTVHLNNLIFAGLNKEEPIYIVNVTSLLSIKPYPHSLSTQWEKQLEKRFSAALPPNTPTAGCFPTLLDLWTPKCTRKFVKKVMMRE
uniref:SAC domain-containing protein n=1 Tax=Ditylenchus dipsaci TaxID=166011 RepID=A0A915CMG1_9BILA